VKHDLAQTRAQVTVEPLARHDDEPAGQLRLRRFARW
jgi:hypothetical protein